MNKKTEKPERVSVQVSKTNFNRVKYGTHTLLNILAREGYRASDGVILIGDDIVSLALIDLTFRPRGHIPACKDVPATKEENRLTSKVIASTP